MTSEESVRLAALSDRAASEENLSAEEKAALENWELNDPAGAAEARVWAAFGAFDESSDPALDARLADLAVERVRASHRRATRGRMWLISGAGALAAAAAAALLFVPREPSEHAAVAVQRPGATLVSATGAVLAAGVTTVAGATIAEGSEVSVKGGIACMRLETNVHLCLADGARARLTAIGSKERRVDVVAGRAAVSLHKLPLGERLSVVAGETWSTAIGTAFTVERLADASVRTVVHEGKVRVGGDGTGELVPAHKIGLAHGIDVQLGEVTEHALTETPEWQELARLAGRSVEEPLPAREPESVAPEAVAPDTKPAQRPGVSADRGAVVAARTRADLLSAARQALRDQSWGAAATAYEALITEHAGSAEARIALIPLAGLEIDRLGRAERGLSRLENYLTGGGALAVEARLARIRALRKLGRVADEALAIEEFVAAHPKALEVPRLSERLESLRGR